MLFAIPFIFMCFGLSMGFLPCRTGRGRLAGVFAVLLGLGFAVTMAIGIAVPGLDGLIFLGLAVFALGPALAALGVGVLIARWPEGAPQPA